MTQTLDLNGGKAVRLAGILDTVETDTGIQLFRLPAWARAQIVDPALTMLVSWPSGGRVEFVTDSAFVELTAMLTRVQIGNMAWPNLAFDVTADGELVGGEVTTDANEFHFTNPPALDFEFKPGDEPSLRFDLPAGEKRVEIWLPHNAAVELRSVAIDDGAIASPAPPSARTWVHYGSSISHCLEASRPTGVWPVVAARHAGVDLQSLAFAGQCMLDQFAARTIRDLDVDLISLKLGINVVNGDTFRERTLVPAIHGVLDTVRDGHPETPIAVITPIICPVAEDHPGPTIPDANGIVQIRERPVDLATGALSLGRIRELLAMVVDARRTAGDKNLHLVDGKQLFGEGDLTDLPDGLHPNAAGYERMGNRFHDLAFTDGGPFATPAPARARVRHGRG
jgi:hypothetical protein